jgi:hypothetical protein
MSEKEQNESQDSSASDEDAKHSSDQPAEGDPDAKTGEGVSNEKPAEG